MATETGVNVLTQLNLSSSKTVSLRDLSAEGLLDGALNFFIFDDVAGKGLYQHQWRTYAPTTFIELLKGLYRPYSRPGKDKGQRTGLASGIYGTSHSIEQFIRSVQVVEEVEIISLDGDKGLTGLASSFRQVFQPVVDKMRLLDWFQEMTEKDRSNVTFRGRLSTGRRISWAPDDTVNHLSIDDDDVSTWTSLLLATEANDGFKPGNLSTAATIDRLRGVAEKHKVRDLVINVNG